jgi:hypothetical protein
LVLLARVACLELAKDTGGGAPLGEDDVIPASLKVVILRLEYPALGRRAHIVVAESERRACRVALQDRFALLILCTTPMVAIS